MLPNLIPNDNICKIINLIDSAWLLVRQPDVTFFIIGPGNSFYARELFVPEAVSSNTGKNLLSEDCLQRKIANQIRDRTTNLSM